MPTANEEWFDISVQHQIDLGRVQSANIQDSIQLLNATEKDLRRTLERRLNRIVETGFDTGRETTARVNRMLDQVIKIRSEAYKDLDKLLTGQVTDLADFEIEFTDATLRRILPIQVDFDLPTAERVSRAVKTKPFQGRVLKDWTRGLERGDIDRLTTTIRQGIVEGLTTQAIVTSVIGTRKLGFKDGILHKSRQGVTAITRTALNHAANEAREEFFKENEDIVKNLVWVAVLDGRTTPICQARSGERFPVGKGPRPPAHIACRSLMVAELDGIGLIGEQATIRDTRTRRVRETNFRQDAKLKAGNKKWKSLDEKQRRGLIAKERKIWSDTKIGQVPADTNYSQWLKRQPAKFQNEVLGKTRAQAFRSGDLTLDKFVDLRTGRRFTLEDLRIKEGLGVPVDQAIGLTGGPIHNRVIELIQGGGSTADIFRTIRIEFPQAKTTRQFIKRRRNFLGGGGTTTTPLKPSPLPVSAQIPGKATAPAKGSFEAGFRKESANAMKTLDPGDRKLMQDMYDRWEAGLKDLDIKVDPRIFNGKTGRIKKISFDTRGMGNNTLGTYNNSNNRINLQSRTGYETFIHEHFHGLDYRLLNADNDFGTTGFLRNKFVHQGVDPVKAKALRKIMEDEFRKTLDNMAKHIDGLSGASMDLKSLVGIIEEGETLDAGLWSRLFEVSNGAVPRISNYSLVNSKEWIAEAGKLMFTNPDKLRRVAPKTFEALKEMLSGGIF